MTTDHTGRQAARRFGSPQVARRYDRFGRLLARHTAQFLGKSPMRVSRLVMALGLALAAAAASTQEREFKLVVSVSNNVSSLTKGEATQYFLKKKKTWPSGQTVQPVDQMDGSPVRRAFSRAVLDKDVGAVRSYWQTQIFSGRAVPPPEKASDAAVLAFVEANPGAIGYVSAGAQMVRGVKEMSLN